jgi:hypothetical protein
MTPELRLDRAERLLMLIVKAGYRARQQSRAQDEKINILIDAQIKTDEQIKSLRAGEERLQAGEESLQAGQARLDRVMAELAEEHKATERSLKAFLDGLQKGHNGKS